MTVMSISALAVVILGIPFIIIIGILYYRSYTNRINHALYEEPNKRRKYTDPGTVVLRLCALVLVVVLLVLSSKITALQEKMDNMESNYRHQLYQLSAQLEELLEEQKSRNNLIVSSSYECGAIDTSTDQVEVAVTLQLKNFTDETEVMLNYESNGSAMENLGNGNYKGTFMAPLFSDYESYLPGVSVTVVNGAEKVNENVEDIYSQLWVEALPQINANTFTSDSTAADSFQINGDINNLDKVSIVGDLTVNMIEDPKYIFNESGDCNDLIVNSFPFNGQLKYDKDGTYAEITGVMNYEKNESEYPRIFYLVATDSCGYVHWFKLGEIAGTENEAYEMEPQYLIYDQNGKLLIKSE